MSEVIISNTSGELILVPSAIEQIKHLQEKEQNKNLFLRITVDGGGCSGFQYQFSLTDETQKDDISFAANGVKVVTDPVSLEFISGSEIHYVQELIGSAFTIKNPNAASSCGCGTSFSM